MDIIKEIGQAAALEQLAEECAELGKAALKLARIKRGENPTPVTEAAAMANLLEEAVDVAVCMDVLDVKIGEKYFASKLDRWKDRIKEAKEGKQHEIMG